MLGGHAADDQRIAQALAPQGFQRLDFVGQLAKALVDQLGLAAGAGGAQGQAAALAVQPLGGKRCGNNRCVELLDPQVDLGAQASVSARVQA